MNEHEMFEKNLKEQFPTFFDSGFIGLYVGKGWFHIVEDLCKNIQYHIEHNEKSGNYIDFKVVQIKEKFAGLRFYYDGGDDTINGMVQMAESWASRSCEECGNLGELHRGSWLKILCSEHAKERKEKLKNS